VSESLAAGFRALGVRRGDRVALLIRNLPEFHVVDLALVRLGAVPFSLYATSSPEKHEYALTDSDAVAIVVDPAMLAGLTGVHLPAHRIQLDGEPDPGKAVDGQGSAPWASLGSSRAPTPMTSSRSRGNCESSTSGSSWHG